jgi:hypothetical protein
MTKAKVYFGENIMVNSTAERKPLPKKGARVFKLDAANIKAMEGAYLFPSFQKGQFGRLFSPGVFTNHIALSFRDRITLCGVFNPDASSIPQVTAFGMICPRCKNLYANAFKRWGQESVEAAKGAERIELQLYVDMITSRKDWVETLSGFRR